ncbi:amino acid adenylation domain-containing protein [Streptomyces murinus]|uniref:amino acid adenylation domain-containing protein n=1 Tax=Streptomyces murinus TaxID=33900 RepID=UPI002377F12D|nr:non-ribosomal peptide synthetase [Streptomyces murinus]WDO05327.1 amino acid adenylation domain-containing protein [Streptomyces murinus]
MIPLSFAQQRLWFLDQMEGPSATYHIPLAVRMCGALDRAALRDALADVVARHEVLRTLFPAEAGTPYQSILAEEDVDLPLPVIPVTENALGDTLGELAAKTFDLAHDLPLRATLLELAPEDHVLLLVVHHIASDGWSNAPLMRDLGIAYGARIESGAPGWEPLPVQYADYTLWQQEVLGDADDPGSVLSSQLDFWKGALAGLPDEVSLPADRPRPVVASYRGATCEVSCPAETHRALTALARETGTTFFMVAQAAVAALLTRSGAGTDIVIGSPVTGRGDEALDDLVGFFVNTLVLRIDTGGDPSFRELLRRAQKTDLAAWAHQDMPFDRLVEVLNPERSASRHPLFQVMLTVGQSLDAAAPELGCLETSLVIPELRIAKFDLTFGFQERPCGDGDPAGFDIVAEYATDLYDTRTVRAVLDRLTRLLTAVAETPDTPIGELDVLAADERRHLDTWAGPRTRAPQLSLDQLFSGKAAATPDAVALVHEEQRITYAELDIWSNRLARHLTARGVTPGSLVAIHLERSPLLIASLLAVLKAGAGYTLLDPQFPLERLNKALGQTGPSVVISQAYLPALEHTAPLIDLTADATVIAATSGAAVETSGHPEAVACVMFTSGSTGTPKGVAASHRALAATFLGPDYLHFGPEQSYLQCSPISWDAFALEVFGPLLHGGTCVLQPGQHTDPHQIVELVERHRITTLQMSASLFNHMLDEHPAVFDVVREAMTAGEAASPTHTARALADHPHLHLINGYGPAESMGFTTTHPITTDTTDATTIPIGGPVTGKNAYVLGPRLELLPPHTPGELYVAGHGLAHGYIGQPALTADRFTADPYGPPGSRMYRTGDLARWNHRGELEYLGRADQQLKLRGFRIEPGEIENVLCGHPSVAQAAVAVREVRPGDKRLVAYVVPGAGSRIEPEALRRHTESALADYMVPAVFVALDALPLTVNGKLDQRALPQPSLQGHTTDGRAPRTPAEEVLCTVFAEVLGLPSAAVDDDFFRRGGHSLLATRLVSRVREIFGVRLLVRDLFRYPTVAALAERIAGDRAEVSRPALVAGERPARLPLSPAQRRLWFLDQMEGPSATYNIPMAIRLTGDLDRAALRGALGDVVGRHEALRTQFPAEHGEPRQQIVPADRAEVPFTVLGADEDTLAARISEQAGRPFALDSELPVRSVLFELAPDHHVLLLVVHHIVSDGWSNTPLMRDLGIAYSARVGGAAPGWEPLPAQYADYTLWQQALLGDADDPDSLIAAQLGHWRGTLEAVPDEVTLPADRPRPVMASYRGATHTVSCPAETHRALTALARETGTTFLMVAQAAVAALLTRSGAGTDIVVGSPVTGRADQALDDLVGFFVNTLVLRTDTSGTPSFRELLRRARDTDLAAWAHQDVPFDRLVEALNPERSASRHPLFQVMLTVGQSLGTGPELGALATEFVVPELRIAKFDLTFGFEEHLSEDGGSAGFDICVEYATDLYDADTVRAAVARLVRLLGAAAEAPDLPFGRLEILGEEERDRLTQWAGPDTSAPRLSLDRLFSERAARVPDSVALVHAEQRITYAELDIWSNRLARHLTARGVRPGGLVAIHLERSPLLIASLLAVLKAGAGYTLLDPQFPLERLNGVLAQTGPAAVISQAYLPALEHTAPLIDLTADATVVAATSGTAVETCGHPEAVACVMFTSGSTGTPKGVAASHRALAATFLGPDYLHFGPEQSYLQCSPISWDAFALEVFGPLLHGTCVLQPGQHTDPHQIVELVERYRITTLQMSASLFNHMLDEHPAVFDVVREAMTAGEAASPTHAARALADHPHLHLINGYGPAESMGFTTTHPITTDTTDATTIPIGGPVTGKNAYILGPNLELLPPNTPGELYVAGHGLAHGYIGQPALTADRFTANPYGPPGSRMYRTGDLARWNHRGEVEYLGRADQQLKLRGFRIEPGEVENVLCGHPSVAQAAVVIGEIRPGNKGLIAYVTPLDGARIDIAGLRAHASASLPDHMIPAAYVSLDALPRTTNGKLDRRALPQPDPDDQPRTGRGPRTPAEEVLCTLFAEVLGLPSAAVDDDFFHRGGHSLLATRLISRIRTIWSTHTTISDLFRHPTPALLAEHIAAGAGGGRANPLEAVLRIRGSAEASAPPLFCVHPISGISWGYAGLLRHIGEEHPVIGLQSRHFTEPQRRPGSIAEMADDYLASIRAVQPHGPYHLIGWSFGGMVAHAVAARLERLGEEVRLLGLLDAYPLPEGFEARPITGGDVLHGLLGEVPADASVHCSEGAPDVRELALLVRDRAPGLGELDGPGAAAVVEATIANLDIRLRHVPDLSFGGDLLFFNATGTPAPLTAAEAWAPYVGGRIEEVGIDCRHAEMTEPEPLRAIGEILSGRLRPARR